jgi:hypothetical protein
MTGACSFEVLKKGGTMVLVKNQDDALVLFCLISETVPFVKPARAASSRWDNPCALRMACSFLPMSTDELPANKKFVLFLQGNANVLGSELKQL